MSLDSTLPSEDCHTCIVHVLCVQHSWQASMGRWGGVQKLNSDTMAEFTEAY